MKTTLKIKSSEEFTEEAEIVDIYGQGCNYPTKKGVNGYEMNFYVIATNEKDEKKEFHIVLQSEARTNNMEGYNGFEMEYGISFGCDADESIELQNFLGDEASELMSEIEDFSEACCKKWFEDKNQWLKDNEE